MTPPQRYRHEPALRAGVRSWDAGPGAPAVFAFAPAGGNGSYFRPLAAALGDGWSVHAVDPPGHGLLPGPALERVEDLAALGRALLPAVEGPLVVCGASLGGFVAHRLALELEREGRTVAGLVVLGTPAYGARGECPSLRGLAGEALLDRLETLGGVPEGLRQHPDLLAQFLRAMATDLAAFDAVEPPTAPLRAPLLALAGHDDAFSPPRLLEGWRGCAEHVELATVPGPHLFLATAASDVARALCAWTGDPGRPAG